MRVIQRYRFNIKTKIPFADWPGIVRQFLMENKLTSGRLLYRFESLVWGKTMQPKSIIRLLKDCPEIGEPRIVRLSSSDTSHEELHVLTNMDTEEPFAEEKLLALAGKMQRGYGIDDVQLVFTDIGFFGRVIPFEKEDNVFRWGAWALHGSGITLYRSVLGDAWLDLNVDVLRDGQLLDASPYRDAMQRLLPGVKARVTQEVVLNGEEKQCAACANQAAEPVLERCRAFFNERLNHQTRREMQPTCYSVAKALKRVGKRHGYAYGLVWNGGLYALHKRTARGNILYISASGGPRADGSIMQITFQGVGCRHRLGCARHYATTQQGLEEEYARTLMMIDEFERTLLPALDDCFPECPEWLEPSDKP